MFRKWRLRRLALAIAVQEARCRTLEKAEHEYASSYYTDMLIEANCELAELKHKAAALAARNGGDL